MTLYILCSSSSYMYSVTSVQHSCSLPPRGRNTVILLCWALHCLSLLHCRSVPYTPSMATPTHAPTYTHSSQSHPSHYPMFNSFPELGSPVSGHCTTTSVVCVHVHAVQCTYEHVRNVYVHIPYTFLCSRNQINIPVS